MGYFRIKFYMSESAYRTGIVSYEVDLGRTARNAAVAYAKSVMKDSAYYCYEIEEY